MGLKIKEDKTKVYKPEITECPLCHSKLKYRYTVSNKVIQFYAGHSSRIKNLGYSCTNPNCTHPEIIYTSQTASKFCVKGYTYSAKILALITYYKKLHYSRDEICNKLFEAGIEISDRNIDIIYEKYKEKLDMDYKKNIKIEYDYMLKEYGQIMISIDCITINDKSKAVSIRNFVTSNQIGLHFFDITGSDSDYNFLDEYLNKELNISIIATVRKVTDFFTQIERRVNDNVKYIHYLKY